MTVSTLTGYVHVAGCFFLLSVLLY